MGKEFLKVNSLFLAAKDTLTVAESNLMPKEITHEWQGINMLNYFMSSPAILIDKQVF